MEKDERRKQLSEFLRTRRARISPVEVGLPTNGRRRTPGLRREEVALLAGVGVDWYTWLEQGRDIRASEQVLTSIARTLRLDETETRYLFMLAHDSSVMLQKEYVSPAIQLLLDNQGNVPALVMGRCWDILAWNYAASVMYGGLEDRPPLERNVMWMVMKNPTIRETLIDWDSHVPRYIAQFRLDSGSSPGDPRFRELIELLTESSEEFRQWWPRHDVKGRFNVCKVYNHPQVGILEVEQTVLQLSENSELKVIILIPVPNTPTLERLHRLVEASQLGGSREKKAPVE